MYLSMFFFMCFHIQRMITAATGDRALGRPVQVTLGPLLQLEVCALPEAETSALGFSDSGCVFHTASVTPIFAHSDGTSVLFHGHGPKRGCSPRRDCPGLIRTL